MRYLKDLTHLPYVTREGRVVAKVGHDAENFTYLHLPRDWQCVIPQTPSRDAVRSALVTMMRPWSEYTWSTPDDAAGMVSAVLAAVARPSLDICPAYLLDASQQGSGKTKAACAIGALVIGERPAITPYAATRDWDEEIRKKLVSAAIDGQRVLIIDNCVGHLRSAALAGVLTSGSLMDRVLGQSRTVNVKVRALMLLSGNNLNLLDADLQRRVVSSRMESGDRPTHRSFSFEPVSAALKFRREIVEAVLTVIRGYFAAGAPDVVAGDAGGFSDWNRLCRQPVLWLAREGLADSLGWQLGDPASSMLLDPSASDPELEALADLLRALWVLSEGQAFTAAEALKWVNTGNGDSDGPWGALRSAVIDLVGRADVSARSLGRALMYRRDRAVSGFKLLASGSDRMKLWRVVQTTSA